MSNGCRKSFIMYYNCRSLISWLDDGGGGWWWLVVAMVKDRGKETEHCSSFAALQAHT